MNVEKQHELIRRYTVTNAAADDSQALETVLQSASAGRGVRADSVYRSQEPEALLKRQHLRSHIQEKGYRGKPLASHQKARNRRRARTSVRLEQVFGHQVTAIGGKRIRTIGVIRAWDKIGLNNLAYNFQRVRFLTATSPHQMA